LRLPARELGWVALFLAGETDFGEKAPRQVCGGATVATGSMRRKALSARVKPTPARTWLQ
jgi:hypothetical protein